MGERRSMGAVDAIWLAMDSPDNLMVIDSVMMLDGPVDSERFESVVQRRLIDRYPVFTERVVEASTPLGMPRWETVDDFTLSDHLHRVDLPPAAGDGAVQTFIEARMAEPLPRDRPLWDLYLVDGHEHGAVVIARFHHALADGIALARVLLSLTDENPTDDLEDAESSPHSEPPSPRPDGGWLDLPGRLTRDVSSGVRSALHLFGEIPAVLSPSFAIEALTTAKRTRRSPTSCCSPTSHAPPSAATPGSPNARSGLGRGHSRTSSSSVVPPGRPSTTSWSGRCPGRSRATSTSAAATPATSRRWSRSTCATCASRFPASSATSSPS
ncbi:wax ester/triacylglycerol synthase domain-containing protein [Ornithinibacter aureus]|nr:wax ester/triacylglycerol synthase domain-containing protein [Ornithinibacter aureus]